MNQTAERLRTLTRKEIAAEAYPGTGAGFVFDGYDAEQWAQIGADWACGMGGDERDAREAYRVADVLDAMNEER